MFTIKQLMRLTLLLFVIATIATTVVDAQSADRPNILWITVEDISPRLGAYGDSLARTPNIDRLAADGVRFTNAFTTAGVCSPSRAAIFTGMYQTSIGAQHMRVTTARNGVPDAYAAVPPPWVKGFPEHLRAAGYYTANYGKTDYQVANQGEHHQPRTAWDRSIGGDGNANTDPVWRERAEGQPFFIVLNNNRTHESRIWPDSTEPRTTDPGDVIVPPYYPDTPIVREDLGRHYDNIARMDAWVGEVLQNLEDDGLAENTVVFFWSDHGDGLPRAKRWIYDSGLRVPLIVRWPGRLEGGAVSDELVSFVDLAPTVLSMAGAGIPAHLEGRAFLGPDRENPPPFIFAARDRIDESYDRIRAVIDGRFKYIRNYYPHQPYILWVPYRNRMPTMQELLRLKLEGAAAGPVANWLADSRPPEEFYDTSSDPHEIENLIDDPAHTDQIERMRRALTMWQHHTGDMGDIPEREMIRRWWPDGVQPKTAAPTFHITTPTQHQEFIPRSSGRSEVGPDTTGPGSAEAGRSTLDTRHLIEVRSVTQGASVSWTTDTGDDAHWHLYSAPMRFNENATVRARAIRYGFLESDESKLEIESAE